MMKKIFMPYQLGLLLMAVAILYACDSDQDPSAERGIPTFKIEESSDPIDHRIYEIYRSTGVQIIYDYKPSDYRWNLGLTGHDDDSLYLITDRAKLAVVLQTLDEVLLQHYSNEFKQKYFPLRIYLADHIMVGKRAAEVVLAKDHMAFSIPNPEVNKKATKDMIAFRSMVNNQLFSAFIMQLSHVPSPEGFFAVSDGRYKVNLTKDLKDVDVREFGFLQKVETLMDIYPRTPTRDEDVGQFIAEMTTISPAEFEKKYSDYPLILNKYKLFTQYVKGLGADLSTMVGKPITYGDN